MLSLHQMPLAGISGRSTDRCLGNASLADSTQRCPRPTVLRRPGSHQPLPRAGGIAAPFQEPAFPGNPAEALQQPTAALHRALRRCHVSGGDSSQARPGGAGQSEAGSRPPGSALRAASPHAASQPQAHVAVTLAELSAEQQARLRGMLWWQGLRLAQEGLTLLRVLLNSDQTGGCSRLPALQSSLHWGG